MRRLTRWPELLLLLLLFAARIIALDALPLHNDEGLHLTRAVEVWNGHPFYDIEDGKVINVWVIALFYPRVEPVFGGRIATVFVGLIGLAGGITLGRLASGRRAGGLLAGLFWVCSPYLFFFERMALADVESGAAVALLTLIMLPGLRLPRRSLWAGAALAAAILFKVSAAPFAGIPLLGMLLDQRQSWRERAISLAKIYITMLILVAPASLYTVARGGFFAVARGWVGGPKLSIVERALQNSATFADTTLTVNGLWALILIGVLFSLLAGRRGLYVLGSVLIPLAILIGFGTEVLDRHFGVIMPLLTVAAAIGWSQIKLPVHNKQAQRVMIAGAAAVSLVWAWGWAWRVAYTTPANFPLTVPMQEQYVSLHPAGYGLREAVWALPQTVGRGTVIASMTADGCKRGRFYLTTRAITLDCVGMAQGRAQIEDALRTTGSAYVLTENPPVGIDPAAVQAAWAKIAEYPRPGNESRITLWQVRP
ncbi:MAG: hypothetical protein IT324_21275 [Anaerolineae bacterium]|nr:hypothetical protein [Anaerolineae bacterium]